MQVKSVFCFLAPLLLTTTVAYVAFLLGSGITEPGTGKVIAFFIQFPGSVCLGILLADLIARRSFPGSLSKYSVFVVFQLFFLIFMLWLLAIPFIDIRLHIGG